MEHPLQYPRQVNQGREAGQAGHSELCCTEETKVPQSARGPEHAMVWDAHIQGSPDHQHEAVRDR